MSKLEECGERKASGRIEMFLMEEGVLESDETIVPIITT